MLLEQPWNNAHQHTSLLNQIVSGVRQMVVFFIIDEVIGKHEHINYAIGINIDGAMREIEIMEYTESYGYEVRNESWRKQFVGKTANMPIKLSKDIDNISGATLSCKHLADGAKRVMVMYDLVLKSYK